MLRVFANGSHRPAIDAHRHHLNVTNIVAAAGLRVLALAWSATPRCALPSGNQVEDHPDFPGLSRASE